MLAPYFYHLHLNDDSYTGAYEEIYLVPVFGFQSAFAIGSFTVGIRNEHLTSFNVFEIDSDPTKSQFDRESVWLAPRSKTPMVAEVENIRLLFGQFYISWK